MHIAETGEVMNLERIPDPSEAEAFEVDMPEPSRARVPSEETHEVRASCATQKANA